MASRISTRTSKQHRGQDATAHWSERKKKSAPCDTGFRTFIKRITESTWFEIVLLIIIVLNTVSMTLNTSHSHRERYKYFIYVVDEVCLAVFFLEFLLKIYAEPINYWKSSYNLFDMTVLILTTLARILTIGNDRQSTLSRLQGVRILRALTSFRTLRAISFIRGLQVLVTALLVTVKKSFINMVFLMCLLIFVFGIMGYSFFGTADPENWGTLGAAMLSLFDFVTVDSWTDFQELLEPYSVTGSRIFSFVFIFIGHYIFCNVFVGLVIMNINDATDQFEKQQQTEREAVIRSKKEFMLKRQQADVKRMLDRQKMGNFTDFHDMLMDFQKTLRDDDYVQMTDLCTNLVWIETMVTSLDHMDHTMNRIRQLHFEMATVLADEMENRLSQGTRVQEANASQAASASSQNS